jgi:hypothetical protein
MGKEIKDLEAKLEEVYRMQLSLPGRFSLRSGKEFTYEPHKYWNRQIILRIERACCKGKSADDLGYLDILPCGTVKHFSFFSFSGENETELNKARIRLQDCGELLDREFIEKVAADYSAKAGEFETLMNQEKALRERIAKIKKEGGE